MSVIKKAIKQRAISVDKVVKITEAMEIVSMFRLKKIEKIALKKKDYWQQINGTVLDLARYVNYRPHKFFSLTEAKKPLLLCIGSDKGLCGGFNFFVVNKTIESKKQINAKIITYGKRLRLLKNYFSEDILEFNDYANHDSQKIAELIFESLEKEKFDSFYIIYNQFKLNILGKPELLRILPLEQKSKEDKDFIWEGQDLWRDFFFTYIKEAIDTSFLESKAAEEFMRIFSMKQANENAKEIRKRIELEFHKLRQNMITRELTNLCAMLR